MKIKIVSDGTPNGSKIVNAETGERIEHIERAEIVIAADGIYIDLRFKMGFVPMDIVAELREATGEKPDAD